MQCPIHTHASNSSRFYTHPWFPSSKVLLPGDVAVIRAIEQGKDHPRRSEVTCELHCLARRMPRATRKKHFSSKISFTWVDLGGRSRKSLLRYCNTNSNGFLGAFRTFYIPLSFLATDSRCTVVASWHNDSVLRSPHWTLLPWVHHCHLHPRPPRSPWRLRDTIGGRNHWNLFFDLPPSLTSTESWNLMKSPRAKTCGRSLLTFQGGFQNSTLVKTWTWTASTVAHLQLSGKPQYRMNVWTSVCCLALSLASTCLRCFVECPSFEISDVHLWLDGPRGSHRKRRSKTARTPAPWGPCRKLQDQRIIQA